MDHWLTEEEYLGYLVGERSLYAWCMVHVGERTEQEAWYAAHEFYKYEPREAAYLGLRFHRPAWDWAMHHLYGSGYHLKHPELAQPSAEYDRLAREIYDEPPA